MVAEMASTSWPARATNTGQHSTGRTFEPSPRLPETGEIANRHHGGKYVRWV